MATCEAWEVQWVCDPPTDGDLASAAEEAAQFIVWAALGRRHGVCSADEAVPVRRAAPCCNGYRPEMVEGTWVNRCAGSCADPLCCWLPLPRTPVRSVTSVTLDGTLLDPGDYFVRADRLYRVGGCWPASDPCVPSPLVVAWSYGLDPPPGAAAAVGEVACELVKGWATGTCRLPSRVVTLTRQGVTMDFGDPTVLLDHGMLGLPVADALIRAVNPSALTMPPLVMSPDWPGTE